jgi:endoglucanase
LKDEFSKYCKNVYVDKFYDVFAFYPGNGKSKRTLLVTAHQDNVGMLVTKVENGFLRITKISGIDPKILPGQEVVVYGKKEIPGIVGSTPPHLAENNKEKKSDFKDLYVDIGAENEAYVKVGDLIGFKPGGKQLLNDVFTSPFLDDRCCIYALAELAAKLKEADHDCNIILAAVSGEETFSLGAKVSSAVCTQEQPLDCALVLDVTFGKTSEIEEGKAFRLGDGVVLTMAPSLDRRVVGKLKSIMDAVRIPYNIEVDSSGNSSDAWALQVSGGGIPCALLSVPIRYMHTPVETVNYRDLTNCISSCEAFCKMNYEEAEAMLCWDF